MLLLLAGCHRNLLIPDAFEIEAPAELAFVGVPVGEVAEQPLQIVNVGAVSGRVTAETDDPFQVSANPIVVEPDGTGRFLVQFHAGTEAANAALVLRSGDVAVEVALSGTVVADVDGDGADRPAAGGDDCDDEDPARSPEREERCNGIDDDCSGAVDDVADPPTWYRDADGDLHGDPASSVVQCEAPSGTVAAGDDCDDGDGDRFPGNPEVWYDGTDQDCDGNDDDQDGDGTPVPDDCADEDPAVLPGAAEVWYDGTDQDCDGNDDDQDHDGSPLAADCDDLDALAYPGAPELDDGRDQSCDGRVDEGLFVAGTLRITELMAEPRAVPSTRGRFFELHNPTDGDVDLSQVTAVAAGSRTALSGWLSPGAVAVVCVDADPARNGGVTCSGTLTWTGNSRSPVSLEAPAALVVDRVPLDTFSVPSGASLELLAEALDAADPASWCAARAPFGDGDLGTPGSLVASCP